eukprot:TRINITY_DN181_c0_g3_i1.p1 TRINITY_DN181_c0_g3~~TRINITY_DN181_c0_g3_i1.p1  ORF type:complete len:424 (-),score=80.39 TRINITY_DN181_c0_g3_i1:108-1379(-)
MSYNNEQLFYKLIKNNDEYKIEMFVKKITNGYTQLQKAVKKGLSKDYIEKLIENKSDINYIHSEKERISALGELILRNNYTKEMKLEIMELMLKNNACPNMKNKNNQNCIFFAVREGSLDEIRLLLKYNADINSSNLFRAVCVNENAIMVAKFLMNNGAEINMKKKDSISSSIPLQLAIQENRTDLAELLIKNKANINLKRNGDKLTTIHYFLYRYENSRNGFFDGIRDKHIDFKKNVKYLMKLNADVYTDTLDSNGQTALDIIKNNQYFLKYYNKFYSESISPKISSPFSCEFSGSSSTKEDHDYYDEDDQNNINHKDIWLNEYINSQKIGVNAMKNNVSYQDILPLIHKNYNKQNKRILISDQYYHSPIYPTNKFVNRGSNIHKDSLNQHNIYREDEDKSFKLKTQYKNNNNNNNINNNNE